MSDAIAAGGAMAYAVLGLGLLGFFVALGAGGMAATRRRVPLTAFIVVPYLVLAIGALGGLMGTSAVHEALEAATPFNAPLVALSATWDAMASDWLARTVAAFVLLVGVWGAALGSAVGAGESRFTLSSSIGAAVFSLIGAGVVIGVASSGGLGTGAYGFAAVILIGGLGVAVAGSRRAIDDGMYRVAAMRFAASASYVLAVFHAGRAADIGNRMTMLGGDAAIMKMADLGKAVDLFTGSIEATFNLTVLGLAFAFIVGVIGFVGEITEVAERKTVYDVFGAVVVMTLVGFFRVLGMNAFDSAYALATNHPAVEMFAEHGMELAAAAIVQGEEVAPYRYYEGGFGDVLHFDGEEWHRVYAWNGEDWEEDHTALADATLADKPPLVVIGRGAQSDKLLPVFEKAETVWIMLKGSSVKAGTWVPSELARQQVTFLPVSLGKTRDLKTELWMEAGALEVNWGPTGWYGEKDDSLDPLEYAASALAASASPGINLSMKGRNIGDLAGTCAPYIVEKGENGIAPPATERWCKVTMDDYDTLRKEAAGLWELPVPQNVTAKIEIQGPLDLVEVEDRLRRELGGLGWCGQLAEKAGEVIDPKKGGLTLHLAVAKDGDVYDTLVDEKSQLQSPTILRCAGKRFRRVTFTMPEPPPEGEEVPVDPKAKPPEPPRASIALTYIPMPVEAVPPAQP